MSVVQSAGEITSIERSWSPSIGTDARSMLRLYGEYFADYAAIYRTQPNIRTVIRFRARNIAQIGFHVFRRISDTDRQRLTDHGLARLMSRPNPFTTRYRLMNSLVHDRDLYDEAFWVKLRVGDTTGVIRIPPTKIVPIGDSWLEPDAWKITGNRGHVDVPAEALVRFHGYNPDDARRGLSPMETMRRIIAEETASGEYRENMWRNGARMEHVITRPADAPVMTPEAKDRFWVRWNNQYAGTTNSGKTALLEEGMDIKPMSFNSREAQYLESRRFNLEEAARFYHVPLPAIGILDNANYSNMVEAHKQLYQDCLGPDLEEIQEEIELQLLPDFPDSVDVYGEFNIADKLKGSFEEQARGMQTAVGGPVMTRNEGRARINLPRIDDPAADELITPMNVIIGGLASPTDTAPKSYLDDRRSEAVLRLVTEETV